MPKEKKYVKLEAGERKAVRQSGAMKAARKGGVVTKIYSGERGGLWTNKGVKSTVPDPETRTKSTPAVDVKRQAGTPESKVYNREQYIKQGTINQGEFEKTRLGSRMVKKATKSIAKAEKKGQDVEVKKYNLEQGVRRDPNSPIVKGLYATRSVRAKRGTVPFEKNKKSEAVKQKLTSDEKRGQKVEAKKQKMANKIARVEERGQKALARKAARTTRRNS
jgi:hypothetical protein